MVLMSGGELAVTRLLMDTKASSPSTICSTTTTTTTTTTANEMRTS